MGPAAPTSAGTGRTKAARTAAAPWAQEGTEAVLPGEQRHRPPRGPDVVAMGGTRGPPRRRHRDGAPAGVETPAGGWRKQLTARSGSPMSPMQREVTGAAEVEAREFQPRRAAGGKQGEMGTPRWGAPLTTEQGCTRPLKPSSGCPTCDDKGKGWSSPGAADSAVCAQQPQPPKSGHSPAGGCRHHPSRPCQ